MTTTIDWGTPWDDTVSVTLEGDHDYVVIETNSRGTHCMITDCGGQDYNDVERECLKATASAAVRGFDPSDNQLRAAGMIA